MSPVGPIVQFDRTADAVYVRVSDATVDRTIELSEDVMVDLDGFGGAVGVELLRSAAIIPSQRLIDEFSMSELLIKRIQGLVQATISASFAQGQNGLAAPDRRELVAL